MNWVQMIDWLAEGQALSEQEAETLFSAVFDGGMPELEMGALLALLQQRPVSRNELHGALSALGTRVFQAPLPALQWRPVLMPAYGAARSHPNLAPLLALSLQRLGIPVLAHGALSGEGGVSSAYLFRELGVMPVASLAQAQQVLAAGQIAFVPTGAISPALANLLALRARLGGGALARLLARLADPFGGGALQLLPAVDGDESVMLQELLCDSGATALIFESADADAVIDAERRPAMTLVSEGRVRPLFDAEATARCAHPLPAAQDLKATARWISGVLEGRIPMPAPIANQIACCLYGCGYAQDLNQAKAIAAVETGSLAAA
ncbi:MAG: DNA-binding protein YbiB [Burkholderiales bacterium]|nr:DNA-binding protein YbiB [Burkholderiales bacterium]